MLEIAVITVSDRAYHGDYEDLSGPAIKEIIQNSSVSAKVTLSIVPDEKEQIMKSFTENSGKDYIITTGGTGISPRDITPDVTQNFCQKELPGISEMLRRESYTETQFAVFSRAFCGIKRNTIIINFPGSVKAVKLCTRLMIPILEHGIKMLHGGKH
jgi:molybdopterin adenylyltransferase